VQQFQAHLEAGGEADEFKPNIETSLITFVVVEIRGDKTRVGIEADKIIPVHREEVYVSIKENGAADAAENPGPEAANSDAA
jgi:carbon storage regulator